MNLDCILNTGKFLYKFCFILEIWDILEKKIQCIDNVKKSQMKKWQASLEGKEYFEKIQAVAEECGHVTYETQIRK